MFFSVHKFTPHKVTLSSHDQCSGGFPVAPGVMVDGQVALVAHPAEIIFTGVILNITPHQIGKKMILHISVHFRDSVLILDMIVVVIITVNFLNHK